MNTVAELASPTGQWPEAVHPRTGGGCMGDGQHAWAAAEWVLYLRNAFVREEPDRLILASGLPHSWLAGGASLRFGPAPTAFGRIDLEIETDARTVEVRWRAQWWARPPQIEVHLLGGRHASAAPGESSIRIEREGAA